MSSRQCPGLRAEMPHQWLAAVGATVLCEGMHLSWTGGLNTHAVLHHEEAPLDALVASWPTQQRIERMPMVAYDKGQKTQKVSRGDFQQLVKDGRGHRDSWTVSSALTDLTEEPPSGNSDKLPLAATVPFNPGLQGPYGSPQKSLPKLQHCTPAKIADTLDGRATRDDGAGIGLDPERFTNSTTGEKGVMTLHAVEMLAYFGLALFPVRGDGIHRRKYPAFARQRGWTTRARQRGAFVWPAWEQPLGRFGIDALLDVWQPEGDGTDSLLGVHAAWRSVVRKAHLSSRDKTFGYTSRRLTG